MDKVQIGKIAGALIASILLLLVINEAGNRLVPLHGAAKPLQVEAEEAGTLDGEEIAEDETRADAEPVDVEPTMAEPPQTTPAIADAIVVEATQAGPVATGAIAPLGKSPLAVLLAAATQKQGQKASKVCRTCHSFDQGGRHKVGPNLWGIVGAQVASAEGFRYSKALSGLGGEWGYETLFRYLANPSKYAPGTKMTQKVKKPEARAAVILFLRSLSDAPEALPALPGASAPEIKVIEVEMPTGGANEVPVY